MNYILSEEGRQRISVTLLNAATTIHKLCSDINLESDESDRTIKIATEQMKSLKRLNEELFNLEPEKELI